jgi:hypothetical protein
MKGLKGVLNCKPFCPSSDRTSKDPWCSMIFMDGIKASRAAAGKPTYGLGLECVRATADRGC